MNKLDENKELKEKLLNEYISAIESGFISQALSERLIRHTFDEKFYSEFEECLIFSENKD